MNRIYSIFCKASVPTATLVVWMGNTTEVWAQQGQASSGGRVWWLGYGLVVMLIVMGVIVVCKPGSRKEIDD